MVNVLLHLLANENLNISEDWFVKQGIGMEEYRYW